MIAIDFSSEAAQGMEPYVRELRTEVDRFANSYRRELANCTVPRISIPKVDAEFPLSDMPTEGIIAPLYRTPWPLNLKRIAPVAKSHPNAAFVFPDLTVAEYLCASPAKIVDTLICHLRLPRFTVTPTNITTQAALLEPVKSAIRTIGSAIVESGLNPNPRSGSISMRIGAGDEAFVVTATRADKRSIGENLVLITAFDPNDGVIVADRADPSSSAGMHAMLYHADPSINAVIHVHCPIITYSDRLSSYRTKRFVPDGFSESFAESIDDLVRDKFAVLRGHGEIAVGATVDQAMEKLRYFKAHAEQEEVNYAVYCR